MNLSYAEKSEKSKNKQFAHAISVIDFLKDEPFSGSTTNHSDTLPPSSSPVKTSEILEDDDTTHNLAPKVISDHEPEQNESSITFSPRSDPLHHEFAGELITLPSRISSEHEDYLTLMTVLCEISTSRSQENVHANQSSNLSNDLIPPGVENDDSEDEDNELPNLDHQDNPSSPRPPPEPPDVEKCLEPKAGMDKAKITRKSSKRANTDTRNGRAQKKPGNQAKVQKSNSRVQEQDGRVNSYSEVLIGGNPQGECHVNMKKAQGMGIFTLESL
ncbi:hypothetical protein Tco_0783066 [Tanacetum coccineum]